MASPKSRPRDKICEQVGLSTSEGMAQFFGFLVFFQEVIPVSRTKGTRRVRQGGRKSRSKCTLLRLPLWTEEGWFCLNFQESVQKASQNYVPDGWKARAFMHHLWFLLIWGDVNSQRCWLPHTYQANVYTQSELLVASLASKECQARSVTVNLKWVKACPEFSTPATVKSELWLRGHDEAARFSLRRTWNWDSESIIRRLVTHEQAGTVGAYKSQIRNMILSWRNIADIQQHEYE